MSAAAMLRLGRLRRTLCTAACNRDLNVSHHRRLLSTCIIGSGPSGLYTAKYLLKQVPDISISILDELPTPYGLVRYGVAPDHWNTKNVINDFAKSVFDDERVEYFGNLVYGEHGDINTDTLKSMFDCIVLSYGANNDRGLNVINNNHHSNADGVFSARTFVNWYNAHPHFADAISTHDLNHTETAIIIGNGNVAIDCARILTQSKSADSKLANTDIARHALTVLRDDCKIREVYIIGRRGITHSSFTNKELREIVSDSEIPEITATVKQSDFDAQPHLLSVDGIANQPRIVQRKAKILQNALKNEFFTLHDADQDHDNGCPQNLIHLRFLLTPKELKYSSSSSSLDHNNNSVEHAEEQQQRLTSVIFERNKVVVDGNAGGDGQLSEQVIGTGEEIEIQAGLVLTSIGYQSELLDESLRDSWDDRNHCYLHTNGKLLTEDNVFVAGWLKRGPTGIIGTNIPDAQETVAAIIQAQERNTQTDTKANAVSVLKKYCSAKNIPMVDKNGWFKIDAYEKQNNHKIVDKNFMLEITQS